MTNRFSLILAGLVAITALSPTLGSAAEELSLRAEWLLTPESKINHPQHKVLSLVAQQKIKIVTCSQGYSHSRHRIITSLGETVKVKQPKGGTAEVTLELITRTGSRELDRWNLKLKDEAVGVTLVDSSGLQEPELAWPISLKSKALPLKLKKNEALLFVVEFKNNPKVLGVKRGGGEIQYDRVEFHASCTACGSKKHPCP